MEKDDLAYMTKLLWEVRDLSKLGMKSEHHMEQIIFSEMNEKLRSVTDFADSRLDDCKD